MKSRRQNVSDSLSIPIDLIIDVFLNLLAKSIARFRSLSKLWSSLLRRKDITDLYLTKSSARPLLLFACRGYFFSANQPQNPDENSSVVIANRLAHLPYHHAEVFAPVNGFFCLCYEENMISNIGRKYTGTVSVLCNPSTGQSFTLPKLKTKRRTGVGSYVGYDPIEKQVKVLSMTWLSGRYAKICGEHQVITLGTDTPLWKKVECCIPHYPGYGSAICINGVLYYKARVSDCHEDSMIVCFDFRSDNFSVLEVKETFSRTMPGTSALVNYNGKLGLLMTDESKLSNYQSFISGRTNCQSFIGGRTRSFELWVLQDDIKQEWSNHIYELPKSWEDVVKQTELYFVGIIGTSEIVLAKRYQSMCCCIFYYNTERRTTTKVVIQGS